MNTKTKALLLDLAEWGDDPDRYNGDLADLGQEAKAILAEDLEDLERDINHLEARLEMLNDREMSGGFSLEDNETILDEARRNPAFLTWAIAPNTTWDDLFSWLARAEDCEFTHAGEDSHEWFCTTHQTVFIGSKSNEPVFCHHEEE